MMPSDVLPIAIGERLVNVVNRISHREGKVLALMNEYAVTLPQVLILKQLECAGDLTLSKIAENFKMSLSSVSQMIDRLHLQGFVERHENPGDRRQKIVRTTPKSSVLLKRFHQARSKEYAMGIANLSPDLLSDLDRILKRMIDEWNKIA
jgi:DNA-binding MarR family transcriptional regulator